ncbi:MAG TPA: hypothetical protein VKB12_02185 [Pyrinomonadaceae bacterium]|nr:hypothetical protein [Pyrinomonadaceae bacterium]
MKISVTSTSPARVHVEGRRREGATAWSFRNFYGSIAGLAERVENFTLSDDGGASIAVRKLAPGEFTAASAATRFAYDVKLAPPAFASDAAHVSWLGAGHGLLMPGDLLPQPLADAKVTIQLPAGWAVSTVDEKGSDGAYNLSDAERAVFAVGRDLREKQGRAAGRMAFALVTAGEWAFNDGEAAQSIEEILDIYNDVTRAVPAQSASVVLLPMPQPVPGNVWAAETRGPTVVLISGSLPSKLAAKAQLDGSLTHELFHLWVPNGLALEGEYDWFYEGFTNYVAMRVAMRRGQLTFNDYLNTLGLEFDAYRAARGAKESSLVEASQKRWAGAASLIYHKGALVAFLYDLTLRRETGGKSSLEDAYPELFRRHARGFARVEGNRALVELLGGMAGMRDFVERYVTGSGEINLSRAIEAFGLRVEPGGARTHVGVAPSADTRQRELLRKLGYNEKLDAEAKRLHDQMKKRPPK